MVCEGTMAATTQRDCNIEKFIGEKIIPRLIKVRR